MSPRVPNILAGVLALGTILASAADTRAQPATAPPPKEATKARTLKLPETSYRYADIELPAHFKSRAVRDLDIRREGWRHAPSSETG